MRCAADLGSPQIPSPPCPQQEGRVGHGAGCTGVGVGFIPSGWQGKKELGSTATGLQPPGKES